MPLSRARPVLVQTNNFGASSYLLNRQLLQFRQRAGEQSHQEGRRAAHDVNHGRGQHRNEGVLPGEGVQQSHHGVRAAREGAEERGTPVWAELVHPDHVTQCVKMQVPKGLPPFPHKPFNRLLLMFTFKWLENKAKRLESDCFVTAVRRLWSRRRCLMFPTIAAALNECLKSKTDCSSQL